MSKNKKVIIVGGGFSGLTLAWELVKNNITVEIYEQNHIGGLISSIKTETHLRETAANSLILNSRLEKLATELNITFIPTLSHAKKRYIFRGNNYYRWPLTFFETISTVFYFLTSKIRKNKSEDLASWGDHVFGKAFRKYILTPATRGIYSVVPEYLNTESFLLSFKNVFPGKSKGTHSLINGMGSLIFALESKLKENNVSFFHRKINNLYDLDYHNSDNIVVLATTAWDGYSILTSSSITSQAVKKLGLINSTGLTTATLVWKPQTETLKGFGCLFNSEDQFNSSGVLINHCLFPNRGPHKSETWIFSEHTSLNDSEILDLSLKDRCKMLNEIKITTPEEYYIQRWPRALPIYNKHLNEFNKSYSSDIEWPKRLYLTGNYLGKIGLAKIYDQNIQLAKKISNELHHA